MIPQLVLSITILIILVFITILVFILRRKLRDFCQLFGANNLKEAFEKTELEAQETPKSFSSMESVLLKQIDRDFPELNLDELKSESEKCILDLFNSVEEKNVDRLNKYSDKIKSYAETMIEDLKNQDVSYDNVKFHKTALTEYKHNRTNASLTITSSLEYHYKVGNKGTKKVQDRIKVEFVYVLDKEEYGEFTKSVGLNCPNCGAPVKSLGEKKCSYCGTALGVLTKNVWNINNIVQY